MFRITRTITLAIILTFVAALHLPSTVEAAATVGEPELVSERHIGHRHILRAYRVTINNEGPGLDDAKVYVSCDAPNVRVIHDVVRFGDIEPHQVATGKHKFFVMERLGKRRHRNGDHQPPEPFDPACLFLELGHDTKLIISGVATDMPLSYALITATVIHPESGRPIIESGRPTYEEFVTTADIDGNYTLEVDTVTQDDFITLRADGTGDQEQGTLTSTVGSVDALHTVGSDGSIVVGSPEFSALDITHVSTALAVLAEQVNGAPITTDADLAVAQAGVIGVELLDTAAVIKTVIDNTNIVLPAGVENTLELVSDSAGLEAYAAELEMNFPTQLAAARTNTAGSVSAGYLPAEVPGVLYLAIWRETPLFGAAFVFDFAIGGAGTVQFRNGSSDIEWAVNAGGEIVVDLLNPPVTQSFPFCVYPGQTSSQCRALNSVERITLIRLVQGSIYDQVFALTRTVTTFPDDPVADEVSESMADGNNLNLAFGPDGIVPFVPAELSDTRIATSYFHQNNDSIGLNASNLGADFLTFDANGTGVTDRRNFAFDWAIDADGIADIAFANGDNNRLVRFRDDGEISRAVLIGTQTNGVSDTLMVEVIEYDGVSVFSEAMLLNRRYRGLFSVIEQQFDFDFLFLPGGTGCRRAPTSQTLQWASTPEGFMDSYLFQIPSSPTVATQRRAWEVITVVPGTLGDNRYWVIENLDLSDFVNPNFPFTDPTVTPGRINSYEFIQDLTGVFDPCAP